MADRIIGAEHDAPSRSARKSFPVDVVIIWMTPNLEQDYVDRDVFPAIRLPMAVKVLANGHSMHCVSPAEAAEVLGDAKAQYYGMHVSRRGLKVSYNRLLRNLEFSLEQHSARAAVASQPTAQRTPAGDWGEYWRGSRGQLEASGFTFEGKLPGEDGGPSPKNACNKNVSGRGRDKRGYPATVHAVDAGFWRDYFAVTVHFPERHRKQLAEAKEAERKQDFDKTYLDARLAIAPTSPAAFVKFITKEFWSQANTTMQTIHGLYGYHMDEATFEAFKAAASDAFRVLERGIVSGKSLREEQAEARRHAEARNDASLQRFLASCKPANL